MEAKIYRWTEVPEDGPIPLLRRRKIEGEQLLVARVKPSKGCTVAVHHHESEQVAVCLSGRALWTLGTNGETREVELRDGEVLHLPSNVPHGVVALEDSEVLDILSPPGKMGIDSQSA